MSLKLKLYKFRRKLVRGSALKREYKEFLQKQREPIAALVLNPNSKPKVLNLNIIDSCNSRCTMCNIWKQQESLEISPAQLKEVLSDPLYSELEYVGVTGGEPTLREDIAQVYEKIIEACPNLKGLSIITNAIEENDVKSRITQIKEVCDRGGVSFSAMVSIDGFGKTHDKVRGTKGNFKTAINTFNYLKDELGIDVSFGCTISKVNAWDADELLYYAKKNGLYGRFRIAESINRLYNQDRTKVIRNFNEDETYNLLLFFFKLRHTFETNEFYQRTYKSIENMLLGGERLIGCPYHNDGLVLGSKGQLSYCAPKSKIIGKALEKSSQDIFIDEFAEKRRILEENCKSCIHDYHAPITPKEIRIRDKQKYYDRYLKIGQADNAVMLSKFVEPVTPTTDRLQIFIMGWYGTETVGDKAILGGIVQHYQKTASAAVEFVIGSIHPFITERTIKELDLEAKVVSTSNFDLLRYAKSSDLVVLGGGPLMDLDHLYIPLIAFRVAKNYGKKTVVFGCGIGPLYLQEYKKAAFDILSCADQIKLRDQNSINYLADNNITGNISLSGDPAKDYIKERYTGIEVEKTNTLSCFLRDWTKEYFDGSEEDFLNTKLLFEKGVAAYIKEQADQLGVEEIAFHHMHNFVIGNDDRDYSRYFVEQYFSDDPRVEIEKRLSTVDSIVRQMKSSQMNICMRFHSVLFAHTLKTNFKAIDYTMGGKIMGFLQDNKSMDRLKNINDFVNVNK